MGLFTPLCSDVTLGTEPTTCRGVLFYCRCRGVNPPSFFPSVVFFPRDFPAALFCSRPRAARPLPPKSRHGVFFGAEYHVAKRSELFLRIRAKLAFIPGSRSWCLARCLRCSLPPPSSSSLQLSVHSLGRHGQVSTERHQQGNP